MKDGTLSVLMIAPGPFFVDRGFGVSLYEQARALARKGAHVEVVCYPSGRDVRNLRIHRPLRLPGYDATRIGPSLTRLPLWCLLLVKTWLVARKTRPDILHAHLHEGALIAAIVSRLVKIQWLFDFQGSLSMEMTEKSSLRGGSLPYRFISNLEGWIDRQAPRILVRSGGMRDDLVRRFAVRPERITRVMDGADPTIFSPRPRDEALRAKLGVRTKTTVVGYIGLLTSQQGIDRLLHAAKIVLASRSDVHFLVMGYPVDEARRRARELGIERAVTFTGRVDYDKTPEYLALVDLAVAPKVSRTEGNGKLYNYASMALPIVAIDNAVNREVLVNDAYYAADETPEAFAEAIEIAFRDRWSWPSRGHRLRARIETDFTWGAVAGRIIEAYSQVRTP